MTGIVIPVKPELSEARKGLSNLNNQVTDLVKNFRLFKPNISQKTEMKSFNQSIENTNKSIKSSNNALANFNSLLKISAGIFAGYKGVSYFNKTADELTRINNRLSLVIKQSEHLLQVQRKLYEIGRDTLTSYKDATDLFVDFSKGLENTNISEARILNVVKTFQQMAALSGSSPEALKGAVVQFTQGLASGTLRGEELNSVLEQMKYFSVGLQNTLGMNAGALRKFAEEGRLTTTVLIDVFEELKESTAKDFEDLTITIEQAFVRLSSSISYTIGNINKYIGASDAFAKKVTSIASSVETLGDSFYITSFIIEKGIKNYIRDFSMFDAIQLTLRGMATLDISPLEVISAYRRYKSIEDYYNSILGKITEKREAKKLKQKVDLELEVDVPKFSIDASIDGITSSFLILKDIGNIIVTTFKRTFEYLPKLLLPSMTYLEKSILLVKKEAVNALLAIYTAGLYTSRSFEAFVDMISFIRRGNNVERAWVKIFDSKSLKEFQNNFSNFSKEYSKGPENNWAEFFGGINREFSNLVNQSHRFLSNFGLVEKKLFYLSSFNLGGLTSQFKMLSGIISRTFTDVLIPSIGGQILKVMVLIDSYLIMFGERFASTFNISLGEKLGAGLYKTIRFIGIELVKILKDIFNAFTGQDDSIIKKLFSLDLIPTYLKAFLSLGEFIIGIFKGVIIEAYNDFKNLANSLFNYFNSLSDNFKIILPDISLNDVLDSILDSSKKVLSQVIDLFKDFKNLMLDFFFEIYDKIVGHSYWTDTINGIKDKTNEIFDVEDKFNAFKNKIVDIFKNIFEFLKGNKTFEIDFRIDSIKAFIKDLKIFDSIPETIDKIKENLSSLAKMDNNWLKNFKNKINEFYESLDFKKIFSFSVIFEKVKSFTVDVTAKIVKLKKSDFIDSLKDISVSIGKIISAALLTAIGLLYGGPLVKAALSTWLTSFTLNIFESNFSNLFKGLSEWLSSGYETIINSMSKRLIPLIDAFINSILHLTDTIASNFGFIGFFINDIVLGLDLVKLGMIGLLLYAIKAQNGFRTLKEVFLGKEEKSLKRNIVDNLVGTHTFSGGTTDYKRKPTTGVSSGKAGVLQYAAATLPTAFNRPQLPLLNSPVLAGLSAATMLSSVLFESIDATQALLPATGLLFYAIFGKDAGGRILRETAVKTATMVSSILSGLFTVNPVASISSLAVFSTAFLDSVSVWQAAIPAGGLLMYALFKHTDSSKLKRAVGNSVSTLTNILSGNIKKATNSPGLFGPLVSPDLKKLFKKAGLASIVGLRNIRLNSDAYGSGLISFKEMVSNRYTYDTRDKIKNPANGKMIPNPNKGKLINTMSYDISKPFKELSSKLGLDPIVGAIGRFPATFDKAGNRAARNLDIMIRNLKQSSLRMSSVVFSEFKKILDSFKVGFSSLLTFLTTKLGMLLGGLALSLFALKEANASVLGPSSATFSELLVGVGALIGVFTLLGATLKSIRAFNLGFFDPHQVKKQSKEYMAARDAIYEKHFSGSQVDKRAFKRDMNALNAAYGVPGSYLSKDFRKALARSFIDMVEKTGVDKSNVRKDVKRILSNGTTSIPLASFSSTNPANASSRIKLREIEADLKNRFRIKDTSFTLGQRISAGLATLKADLSTLPAFFRGPIDAIANFINFEKKLIEKHKFNLFKIMWGNALGGLKLLFVDTTAAIFNFVRVIRLSVVTHGILGAIGAGFNGIVNSGKALSGIKWKKILGAITDGAAGATKKIWRLFVALGGLTAIGWGAAIAGVGAGLTVLFAKGETFAQKLEYSWDLLKKIIGLKPSTETGRYFELLSGLEDINLGELQIDFAKSLKSVDFEQMSKSQYLALEAAATEAKETFAQLRNLYVQNGKLTEAQLKEGIDTKSKLERILGNQKQVTDIDLTDLQKEIIANVEYVDNSFWARIKRLVGAPTIMGPEDVAKKPGWAIASKVGYAISALPGAAMSGLGSGIGATAKAAGGSVVGASNTVFNALNLAGAYLSTFMKEAPTTEQLASGGVLRILFEDLNKYDANLEKSQSDKLIQQMTDLLITEEKLARYREGYAGSGARENRGLLPATITRDIEEFGGKIARYEELSSVQTSQLASDIVKAYYDSYYSKMQSDVVATRDATLKDTKEGFGVELTAPLSGNLRYELEYLLARKKEIAETRFTSLDDLATIDKYKQYITAIGKALVEISNKFNKIGSSVELFSDIGIKLDNFSLFDFSKRSPELFDEFKKLRTEYETAFVAFQEIDPTSSTDIFEQVEEKFENSAKNLSDFIKKYYSGSVGNIMERLGDFNLKLLTPDLVRGISQELSEIAALDLEINAARLKGDDERELKLQIEKLERDNLITLKLAILNDRIELPEVFFGDLSKFEELATLQKNYKAYIDSLKINGSPLPSIQKAQIELENVSRELEILQEYQPPDYIFRIQIEDSMRSARNDAEVVLQSFRYKLDLEQRIARLREYSSDDLISSSEQELQIRERILQLEKQKYTTPEKLREINRELELLNRQLEKTDFSTKLNSLIGELDIDFMSLPRSVQEMLDELSDDFVGFEVDSLDSMLNVDKAKKKIEALAGIFSNLDSYRDISTLNSAIALQDEIFNLKERRLELIKSGKEFRDVSLQIEELEMRFEKLGESTKVATDNAKSYFGVDISDFQLFNATGNFRDNFLKGASYFEEMFKRAERAGKDFFNKIYREFNNFTRNLKASKLISEFNDSIFSGYFDSLNNQYSTLSSKMPFEQFIGFDNRETAVEASAKEKVYSLFFDNLIDDTLKQDILSKLEMGSSYSDIIKSIEDRIEIPSLEPPIVALKTSVDNLKDATINLTNALLALMKYATPLPAVPNLVGTEDLKGPKINPFFINFVFDQITEKLASSRRDTTFSSVPKPEEITPERLRSAIPEGIAERFEEVLESVISYRYLERSREVLGPIKQAEVSGRFARIEGEMFPEQVVLKNELIEILKNSGVNPNEIFGEDFDKFIERIVSRLVDSIPIGKEDNILLVEMDEEAFKLELGKRIKPSFDELEIQVDTFKSSLSELINLSPEIIQMFENVLRATNESLNNGENPGRPIVQTMSRLDDDIFRNPDIIPALREEFKMQASEDEIRFVIDEALKRGLDVRSVMGIWGKETGQKYNAFTEQTPNDMYGTWQVNPKWHPEITKLKTFEAQTEYALDYMKTIQDERGPRRRSDGKVFSEGNEKLIAWYLGIGDHDENGTTIEKYLATMTTIAERMETVVNRVMTTSPTGYATGGYISGPGTSISDSIPAMLSNGEYVINAESTRRFRPLLDRINGGKFEGFFKGGAADLSSTNSTLIEQLLRSPDINLYSQLVIKDLDSIKSKGVSSTRELFDLLSTSGYSVDSSTLIGTSSGLQDRLLGYLLQEKYLKLLLPYAGEEQKKEALAQIEATGKEIKELLATAAERTSSAFRSFKSDFSRAIVDSITGVQSEESVWRSLLDNFTRNIVEDFTNGLVDSLFKTDNGFFNFEEKGKAFGNLFSVGKGTPEKVDNTPLFTPSCKTESNTSFLSKLFSDSPSLLPNVESSPIENLELPTDSLKSGMTNLTEGFSNLFKGFDFSNLFKGFTNLFKNFDFSNLLTNLIPLFGFAEGGQISGPGTGTSDSIIAAVSNGEYIINAASTKKYRPVLDMINNNQVPKFADGGYINISENDTKNYTSNRLNSSSSSPQVFNIQITGDISRQTKSEIYNMLPQIASGVNSYNRERNY